MNAAITIVAVALLLWAAPSSAKLDDSHICVGVDSKPTDLRTRTLLSDDRRALVKGSAYFEIINGTGEYFPMDLTEVKYVKGVDQTRSYMSIKGGECGHLDLYFTEFPDEGIYRADLFKLYLRKATALKYQCSNTNPGIEFRKGERFAPEGQFLLKCHKNSDGPAHAEIVLQDLEINLDADDGSISDRRRSEAAPQRRGLTSIFSRIFG